MEENKGPGAPTKYKEKYHCDMALKFTRMGFRDTELAEAFDISESTLNEWKKKHRKFSESIKKGKEETDSVVVDSLLKRATGFEYDETTFEKVDNKENLQITKNGEIKTEDSYRKKIVTKQIPPDVTAQIFWLKNRQPKLWRDKQEIENTNKNFNVNLTKDEVKDISKMLDDEC